MGFPRRGADPTLGLEARMTTVREGRDRYLEENGFSVETYTAPTFTVPFLRWNLTMPNTRARQQAVPLHDLHHVATGHGTDYVGEAEIGAFELAAGCTSFITYYLNGMAALFGMVIAPVRVVRAWRRAKGAHTLYRKPLAYDEALTMSVGELRAHLGIPPE